MSINKAITAYCTAVVALFLLTSCGKGNPAAPGEEENSHDGGSGSAKVTVKVVNRLFAPIDLSQEGGPTVTLSMLDSMEIDLSPEAGKPLRWTMKAITGAAGTKMGETLSSHFVVENRPDGEQRFEVSNMVGDQKYFALLLGNTTSQELMFGINMGLSEPDNLWERKCYCPLAPQSPLVYMGYYRLLESSNIRVYRYGTEYSGPYDLWLRFSNHVDDRSGIIILNVYAVPAGSPATATTPQKGIGPLSGLQALYLN